MVNCIIIHGSPVRDETKDKGYIPDNKGHWLPWIKKELEKHNIETFIPLMPTPWNPKYEEWKKEFEKLEVNESTVLIGYSAGGAFLVRWLGETDKRVKKLILVAPGKVILEENVRFSEEIIQRIKILKEFYDFGVNRNIRNNVSDILIFISDDLEEFRRSAQIYRQELGAGLVELKGKGHFLKSQMGTEDFPELLEEVLK